MKKSVSCVLITLLLGSSSLHRAALAQSRPRARDLGVPFDGTPGPWNAITDVGEVEVGHTTLIQGEGDLKVGDGPVRTGVTVILPRGKRSRDPVFAGWFALNGNGEMTGTTWVEESGFMEGPMAITNTHSVGTVRDAIISWQVRNGFLFQPWSLPVVAETYDGYLNDINGFHVKSQHVVAALQGAAAGAVAEGSVGGGTGMICYEFKGGIGTASRKLEPEAGGHTVGVLVQANFGRRDLLRIGGAPVGLEMREGLVWIRPDEQAGGSIIIVVATDAPLLPHQLKRLARRASLGVARTGSTSSNFSGDIFIAFSTANARVAGAEDTVPVKMVPNSRLNPIFQATVESTEEAIVNALVAAETMTGVDGHRVLSLPHERLRQVLKKYNRLLN
ncbi:MAG: P1 family peptidase [Acidobacteriota bacterium]